MKPCRLAGLILPCIAVTPASACYGTALAGAAQAAILIGVAVVVAMALAVSFVRSLGSGQVAEVHTKGAPDLNACGMCNGSISIAELVCPACGAGYHSHCYRPGKGCVVC